MATSPEDLARVVALLSELRSGLEDVSARVEDLAAIVRAGPGPRALSIDDACTSWGFSRATFARWLADSESGLESVVIRPNGPGGRVLVPVEAFEAWLRARAGPVVAR